MAVGQRDPPSKRFRVLDRPLDVLVGMPRSGHRQNPSRLLTVVNKGVLAAVFSSFRASAGLNCGVGSITRRPRPEQGFRADVG
jgi:hypothetical protein